MRKNSPSNRGFTLIELLTVIAIIAVLAGLLFPAISAAMKKTKITKASIEAHSIETAWTAYFNEYGQWPVAISGASIRYLKLGSPVDANVTNCKGIQTTPDTTALLLGIDTSTTGPIGNYNSQVNNPKLIQFTNLKKDSASGEILDPWGNPYRFIFDTSYVNQIANNFLGTVANPIARKVIVWSAGPDGKDNTADDVKTWQ